MHKPTLFKLWNHQSQPHIVVLGVQHLILLYSTQVPGQGEWNEAWNPAWALLPEPCTLVQWLCLYRLHIGHQQCWTPLFVYSPSLLLCFIFSHHLAPLTYDIICLLTLFIICLHQLKDELYENSDSVFFYDGISSTQYVLNNYCLNFGFQLRAVEKG